MGDMSVRVKVVFAAREKKAAVLSKKLRAMIVADKVTFVFVSLLPH